MTNVIASKINQLILKKKKFIFIIDYQIDKHFVLALDEIKTSNILYDFAGFSNAKFKKSTTKKLNLSYQKPKIEEYKKAFDTVIKNIKLGNSYLCNLTFATLLDQKLSLKEIFYQSNSKYKLWLKSQFCCFSPEPFIKIKNNKIYAYPMKGTISSLQKNAKRFLINSKKEQAEHITIVDLLRNDLAMVSKNVQVEKFRYLEKIKTQSGFIYQTSSIIRGELDKNYQKNLGDLITKLLPAGSITGAPKKSTLQIIEQVETFKRGFYTGVCGYFDGDVLDSSVMIRFIEQSNGNFYFKSGGGITINSDLKSEYKEILDKIYVPIF